MNYCNMCKKYILKLLFKLYKKLQYTIENTVYMSNEVIVN